jgi:hypothetical protein
MIFKIVVYCFYKIDVDDAYPLGCNEQFQFFGAHAVLSAVEVTD